MLRYLLINRMHQKKPVLLCEVRRNDLFLFDQGEVFYVSRELMEKDPDHLRFKRNLRSDLWILMDSTGCQGPDFMIPPWIHNMGLIPKFIFASSLIPRRRGHVQQNKFWLNLIYMNPWSPEEARLLYVETHTNWLLCF